MYGCLDVGKTGGEVVWIRWLRWITMLGALLTLVFVYSGEIPKPHSGRFSGRFAGNYSVPNPNSTIVRRQSQ